MARDNSQFTGGYFGLGEDMGVSFGGELDLDKIPDGAFLSSEDADELLGIKDEDLFGDLDGGDDLDLDLDSDSEEFGDLSDFEDVDFDRIVAEAEANQMELSSLFGDSGDTEGLDIDIPEELNFDD